MLYSVTCNSECNVLQLLHSLSLRISFSGATEIFFEERLQQILWRMKISTKKFQDNEKFLKLEKKRQPKLFEHVKQRQKLELCSHQKTERKKKSRQEKHVRTS